MRRMKILQQSRDNLDEVVLNAQSILPGFPELSVQINDKKGGNVQGLIPHKDNF